MADSSVEYYNLFYMIDNFSLIAKEPGVFCS